MGKLEQRLGEALGRLPPALTADLSAGKGARRGSTACPEPGTCLD